jgi:hypothetical protein
MKEGKPVSVMVDRLGKGEDALDWLNRIVRENRISAVSFTALGAVGKAVFPLRKAGTLALGHVGCENGSPSEPVMVLTLEMDSKKRFSKRAGYYSAVVPSPRFAFALLGTGAMLLANFS